MLQQGVLQITEKITENNFSYLKNIVDPLVSTIF